MSDIDSIIEKCIDDIWKAYDKDNSGFLDKQETKAFVKNTLSEMGENGEFSDNDFEACFKEFDKDGNGTISKDEMKAFIKKVAGLWTPTYSIGWLWCRMPDSLEMMLSDILSQY